MEEEESLEKVAVIGLDGLSWRYFNKILKAGAMRYTKSLHQNQKAYKSVLEATIPPSTPPSWSSIMTGVNPGKHGIFAFDYVDTKTLKQRLFTALDLMHPRIHEMLAMKGIRSVMINPIPDYPLIPIRHANIITHLFFTPKILYYPQHMRKYVKNLFSAEEIRKNSSLSCMEKSLKMMRIYEELIRKTVEDLDWRLYWVNLNVPDFYLHARPELLFDKTTYHELELFSIIDRIVRLLTNHSDALIIVSDHGFSFYKWRISINDLLFRHGLVKIGQTGKLIREHHELQTKREYKYMSKKILPILRILYSPSLKLARKSLKKIYRLFKGKPPEIRVGIDTLNSKAFMGTRYSHGVYVKSSRDVQRVIELLKDIRGIKWVKPREEVYWGSYINRAPPVIVCPDYDQGFFLALNRVYGRVYLRVDTSDHHPDGVFMLYAPSLHIDASWPQRLPTYFVTPFIMWLLDIPLPSKSDSIDILRKIIGNRINHLRFTNEYLEKWRIVKKSVILRRRIRKQILEHQK